MSISKKLMEILDKNKVKYEKILHQETFTSQETAQAEHVSGKKMAKVVMTKVDGKDVMAVLPASFKLDVNKLKRLLRAKEARLATEKEFERLFPDCEKGAMPPFGNLYGIPCYVDSQVAQNDKIVFNAGSHKESVKMSYADYEKIVKPVLMDLILEEK
jgi:Ala-tRNA(Pro) deacylase